MKALTTTLAFVLGCYGLFYLLSVAGQSSVNTDRGTMFHVPPYEPPPAEEPQYGGTLNVGHVNITQAPMSWDPADWNSKQNQDTGMYFEQLFAGDLDKSVRKGGPYPFTMAAYLPAGSIRGEIAETWEWEDPLTLVIHVRRGVMFPEKPGIMKRRELTAEDVVFSYYRQRQAPKALPGNWEHIDSVTVRDDFTVVFNLNQYNAEWDYRYGYGYYSGILPRELKNVDVTDWRNAVGSGPFQVADYAPGICQTYAKTPGYWDRETLNGKRYEIPFIDELKYRTLKDKATWLTALRTGQIDILESINWLSAGHLRKSTPELKWSRWLASNCRMLVMRCDQEPFDDIRVRRALNLAVDQRKIVKHFFGGNAELFAFPQKPEFIGYYEPLEKMPKSVQELFTYNPQKAKQLLAEAGYPDGFSFVAQVNANDATSMDLVPLVADYLSRVGVMMKLEPMEYVAFLSLLTTGNHGPGYFSRLSQVNPITSLRMHLETGFKYNYSRFSDPEIDVRLAELCESRDANMRQEIVKEITAKMLDRALYIWLPVEYSYTAWWPWVKNYNGELRAGAIRAAPIYARLWIDREMKKEMGFD